MRCFISLVIFCAAVQLVNGQNAWGQIDPKQFEVRACPIDSSANAMILFERCVISFKYDEGELKAIYNIRRRIQILNKEGFDEGTVKLEYYSVKDYQKITDIKAQTINAGPDSKPQIIKVDSKSIFDEKVSDNYSARKFVFPEVKEGSVIEYEYTLESTFIRFLHDWVFQHNIPTMRSYVKLQCPSFLHYTAISETSIPLSDNTSEYKSYLFPSRFYFGREKYQGETADVDGKESLYAINNIPALKEEKYITTMKDYEAKMVFVLSGITMPQREPHSYTANWDELVDELMKNSEFGLYLNGISGEHLKAAKAISEAHTNALEKARAIYANVAGKVKWNEKYSVFPTDRLARMYNDGKGSSADINMILLDMLRTAGLKADPVLISTRHNGKVQKLLPDIAQFNHVIVLLETDSGNVFLDATNGMRPFGLLSVSDLNTTGLRMSQPSSQWVSIVPMQKTAENIMSSLQVDGQGNISGNVIVTASNYEAAAFRYVLMKKPVGECLKQELKFLNEVEVSNVKTENKTDIDQKLKFTFNVSQKAEDQDSNLIYLKPFLIKFRNENPFKLSKRTYPVNFGYPFEENLKMTVVIPEGYKISDVPKSIQAKLSDESASFTFLVAQEGQSIQVSASLKVKGIEYQPEVYESLKNLFDKMNVAYNSVVVLEKK